MTPKEKFIEIYSREIFRNGSEKLLEWLLSTDFFEAPASTKYHLSRKGGLCEHSINVYFELIRVRHNIQTERDAICGLLHDVCKANFYKVEMRNAKDESGQWVKVPYYAVEEKFPYGHGEKSAYLINQFMTLTHEEAMAIRWHMGGFDDNSKNCGAAFAKYPLAVQLHVADLAATYITERDDKQ